MDSKDFEQWEKEQATAKKRNNRLLVEFKKWLEGKSLKPKTVDKHIFNVETYANDYLLRYEIIPVEKGTTEIGWYLGDFFIRKAMWSSPNAVKENISSFKKFYTFLNEIEILSTQDLNEMKQLIKGQKHLWIEAAQDYNDSLDEW